MFGRTPRLPVDLAFDLPVRGANHKNHSQYIKSLKSKLEESFKIASSNAAKSADRNKARFDNRVRPSALEPGDHVLVRNVRLRGKHKLSDKWEEEVYVVVHRAGDLPVYKVKPESRDGPMRTLHRDLLLPCGFLTENNDNLPSAENSPVQAPRTRQQSQNPDSSTNPTAEEDDSERLESFNFNPPTLRFTVEKQLHDPVPVPSPRNNDQRTSITDSPVETENENEQRAIPSNTLPSVTESSYESPESDERENLPEPVENEPNQTEIQNLPENEEILTDVPVVSIEDSPESSPGNSNPVEIPENDTDVVDVSLRCSQRQREQPQRLQYCTRGNPLISVVQNMLHSLSDALNVTVTDAVRRPFTLSNF